ncbi:MAG: hypothetical protein GC168_12730 [Candidatus Hydrogenedens sp.]|nr:hypothetical protein [Candidatus Hydrogenedens sp.]
MRWAGGAASGARALLVDYAYTVDGVSYTGRNQDAWLQRALYAALPKSAIERLAAQGYLRFEDLPPEVVSVLRKKGVESFHQIPAHLFQVVYDQGYRTLYDLPRHWLAAARGGDYAFVAHKLDTILPDAGASVPLGFGSGRVGSALPGGAGFDVRRGAAGTGFLTVYFDPANPARHVLVGLPGAARVFSLLAALLFAAAAVAYAVIAYPRVRRYVPQSAPSWVLRWN